MKTKKIIHRLEQEKTWFFKKETNKSLANLTKRKKNQVNKIKDDKVE